MKIKPVAALLVTLLLVSCYTVPETGRSSMILVSTGQEAQLGASEFAEIKAKERPSKDVAASERVRRIGRRIATAVGDALPGAQWEFVLFDSPDTINAFALPGGKVGVYSGLLKVAESDDELAIVMGHEIAHVTSRHGAERMSQGMVAGLLGVAVGAATNDSRNRDLWRIAYGVGAAGMQLKYSRNNESEADYIGLRYAAKAGYDPRVAINFWRKMSLGKQGPRPPVWLSTHPSDEQRIADLQRVMPTVLPLYFAALDRLPKS